MGLNNSIMRKIVVGATYAPLATTSTVGSFTVSCPPANAGVVYFLGDDGSDVPWIAGEYHDFSSIDLSTIMVKGTLNDTVTVIGGTW